MKSWMLVLIAIAGGIGLWLYTKYRKEAEAKMVTPPGTLEAAITDIVAIIEGKPSVTVTVTEERAVADIAAAIAERPAGVTPSEAMKGVTTELVKTGLEEFGVDINRAVDVVARQAGMLDSDIGAMAGRELRGQDISERIDFIADTYKIDSETIRDMVTANQSQYSESYRIYCEKVRTGEYTKPWYTYQHEQLSVYKQEQEAQVEDFHETRERGETFQQWERRTSGTTTREPIREPTRETTVVYRTRETVAAPRPIPTAPAPTKAKIVYRPGM